MFGHGQARGGRGRGRVANGQRPVSEGNRISIADQLAQFQAGDETGPACFCQKEYALSQYLIFTSGYGLQSMYLMPG